ncbi:MAG: hypothetical protein JWN70_3927 [Planctomycetaceae bacterium]|nr:hypothetical protein [Planctomycetaceae bacterium]
MVRAISHLLVGFVVISASCSANVMAELAPARPKSLVTKPALPLGAKSPRQISGRAAVIPGRERLGVTVGTGTTAFPSGPIHNRPDGFMTNTRKLGDNTVVVGQARTGMTRSISTDMLGVSKSTRTPQIFGRSGLSTPHSTGRSWSGFKRVK